VWTDCTRRYLNSWLRANDPLNPNIRGVSHYDKNMPQGNNEGYLDNHVEWARFSLFSSAAKMQYNGQDYYFYGGKP
jgi:hypothetical protein